MGKIRTTKEGNLGAEQIRLDRTEMERYYDCYLPLRSKLRRKGGLQTPMPEPKQFRAVTAGVAGFSENLPRLVSSKLKDYELVRKHLAFTIFVPAGKATRAHQAVSDLTEQKLLRGFGGPTGGPWVNKVASIIRPNVRFHRQKSKRLYKALQGFRGISNYVQMHKDGKLSRQGMCRMCHTHLLNHTPGLGPKATAHLMRNWGMFTQGWGYPIIDVHIHKALEATGRKHRSYKEAESSFYDMANEVSLHTLLLDAYIWCDYAGSWDVSNADFGNFSG